MSVILNSVFTPKTSYGVCGLNIALALQEFTDVEAIPIGQAEWQHNQPFLPLIQRGQYFSNSSCIRLYHEFDLSTHHGKGLHVGFPIFEKTNFLLQEIHQLNSVDLLFVPTQWAKSIIEQNRVKTPVNIVNLGVDRSIFKERTIKDKPFTFFYPGKFEIRKSFDIVMELFERAFSVKDDIEIIFLPINQFIGDENNEWIKFLQSSTLSSKIKIIGRLDTDQEVAEIYQDVDCVVSFSRAEGWNLPLLEGLSCGCSVVATNYSAHTEFLNNENASLAEVDGFEPALDGKWFTNPNNKWALIGESCKSQLVDSLREIYKNGKKINTKGIETANRFTWRNSAQQIIQHLNGK